MNSLAIPPIPHRIPLGIFQEFPPVTPEGFHSLWMLRWATYMDWVPNFGPGYADKTPRPYDDGHYLNLGKIKHMSNDNKNMIICRKILPTGSVNKGCRHSARLDHFNWELERLSFYIAKDALLIIVLSALFWCSATTCGAECNFGGKVPHLKPYIQKWCLYSMYENVLKGVS